jgi:hypothetical protein
MTAIGRLPFRLSVAIGPHDLGVEGRGASDPLRCGHVGRREYLSMEVGGYESLDQLDVVVPGEGGRFWVAVGANHMLNKFYDL